MIEKSIDNKYLTTKNILWVFGIFILTLLLYPGFGGNYYLSIEAGNSLLNAVLEVIFLSVLWGFSSIVKRNWKKMTIMFLFAFVCYVLVMFLSYPFQETQKWILFVNPITLSLIGNLLYDKKYRLLLPAYFIGVLSFCCSPVICFPIVLFLQLFLSEYPIGKQSKSQSFLSRLMAYFVIGTGFMILEITSKSEPFSQLYIGTVDNYIWYLIASLIIIAGYWLLYHTLGAYYTDRKWKYVLSYIPVLWLIPLISIPFENKNKINRI